jgi:hypothetical protein
MARKPINSSHAPLRAKRPPIAPQPRIRMPSSWRFVTARLLRPRDGDKRPRAARREVPEIRLSGAWLERVGFPKGTRYLIMADRPFQTIILQAAQEKKESRRRR